MKRKKSKRVRLTSLKNLPKYLTKSVDMKRLYKLLKNNKNEDKYKKVKDQYNIGTYGLSKLRKYGASHEDIIKYYQRELDILTGKYEEYRRIEFIDSYGKALSQTGNYSEEEIDKFKDTLKALNKKDFKKVIDKLPDIPLYYINEGMEDNEPILDLGEIIEEWG